MTRAAAVCLCVATVRAMAPPTITKTIPRMAPMPKMLTSETPGTWAHAAIGAATKRRGAFKTHRSVMRARF